VACKEAADSSAYNNEHWIFVNGMCVDNNLGYANAMQLSKLFNRKIEFFHNPTQGLLFDFIECMIGRTFNFQTPVSRSLAQCLTKALNAPYSKVVLVAHSQGGIISSNAVELLIERNLPVQKLEVYTFGSAADKFEEANDVETKQSYPYYEHYANEDDYVAKIGVLHWHLPGNVYSTKRDGHLLGDHYLPTFKQKQYSLYCGVKVPEPRLYRYMDEARERRESKTLHKTIGNKKQSNPYRYSSYFGHPYPSPCEAELGLLSPSPTRAQPPQM